jgi:hypothetical protein
MLRGGAWSYGAASCTVSYRGEYGSPDYRCDSYGFRLALGGGSTAINEIENTNFKIYPNPAKDEIFIKSESQIKKVEIYSLMGLLLLSESNFNEKISMRNFAEGVYLVKIYTDKGSVVSKVVKK